MDQPSYFADEERKNDFLKVIEGMAELPEPFAIVHVSPAHSRLSSIKPVCPGLCDCAFLPSTHCPPSET